ncbi:MAG: hypothetical protein ACYS83_08530 [Planctomycetota bacterium]|jgi:hypothetical protein
MKYPHWQYYKSVLGELETISRYVEISLDNYSTYGTEFTRLLLSVCSEVDVVAKLLCKNVDADESAGSIQDYRRILSSRFPGLPKVEVSLPKYVISLTPWCEWLEDRTPKWWSCYNRVKHKRDEHFREGNLENVLFATGGLCVLVSYLYYKDFVSEHMSIMPLFMFLDRKYLSGCKPLTKGDFKLPDFEDGEK